MANEKNAIFEAFARKAAERIEERKKLRTMRRCRMRRRSLWRKAR